MKLYLLYALITVIAMMAHIGARQQANTDSDTASV
jgi:hypothetical protein